MPNAIYNYVYYEPLTVGGPVTRQNRNPATSSKYLPIPGITVPSTNDLATGSTFTPDVPPSTYTDGSGNTYNFGFMNVSGCVGAGETSTDYSNLPGSGSFAPLIVGTQVINILVVYIVHGTGGGGGGPAIYLDAFDETTGAFLDNFFVNSISPDSTLAPNVNVYGSLAVEAISETVEASTNPLHTTGVADSSAVFDKWVKLEGPSGNPVISGGSVDLVVGASTPSDITAFAFYKDPASVYITGGYQSPDIILFTPFSTTSLGTPVPIGLGDTTLLPGVSYGFAAVIHNDSEYEVSCDVTFWNIPGGVGTAGTFLDTQTVVIEALSSQTVISSMPFINPGGHTCAVVSIDTDDSPCQFDPTGSADSVYIPNPLSNVAHSCSAWRNTDAMFIFHSLPWHFEISLGELPVEYEGVQIGLQFRTQHVPVDFAQKENVLKESRIHRRIYGKTPPYLIPALREKLHLVDLKPTVSLDKQGELSVHPEGNGHLVNFRNKKETKFTVSGIVPENAKPGDTYLFQVTARYPRAGRLAAKTIEFLEILIVKGK